MSAPESALKWQSASQKLSAAPRRPGCGCNLTTILPRPLNPRAKSASAATSGRKLPLERDRERFSSGLWQSIVDGNRSEVGNENTMRDGIDDQRMPAEMSRRIFEHSILLGGILLDHGHGANGVCSVDAPQLGVVTRAVHARADGENGDDLSVVRVEHDKVVTAAASNHPVIPGLYT